MFTLMLHQLCWGTHTTTRRQIDHLVSFASRKLSDSGENYVTTEREWLDMVYVLQKFQHYLLGNAFILFINHSTLST